MSKKDEVGCEFCALLQRGSKNGKETVDCQHFSSTARELEGDANNKFKFGRAWDGASGQVRFGTCCPHFQPKGDSNE